MGKTLNHNKMNKPVVVTFHALQTKMAKNGYHQLIVYSHTEVMDVKSITDEKRELKHTLRKILGKVTVIEHQVTSIN